MSSDNIKAIQEGKGFTNWGRFWVLISILHLAGITSLASFVVSYNPRHFRRFFLRAKDMISDQKKSDE